MPSMLKPLLPGLACVLLVWLSLISLALGQTESDLEELLARDGGDSSDFTFEESSMVGYEVEPMMWTGTISPNGTDMTFNGTYEQIYEHILAIDPNFTWDLSGDPTGPVPEGTDYDFAGDNEPEDEIWDDMVVWDNSTTSDNSTSVIDDSAGNSRLIARKKHHRGKVHCNGGGRTGPTSVLQLMQGEDHLRSVGGRCGVGAGKCARVSCSYGSGIWLCNHHKHKRLAPRCKHLVPYVKRIIHKCQHTVCTSCTGGPICTPLCYDYAGGKQRSGRHWHVAAGSAPISNC